MELVKSPVYFDSFIHGYLNENDEEIPGVTTLLKKHGLGVNYSGIDEAILAKAAARGTAIHKALEAHDNGLTVEEYLPEVDAYAELCKENNLEHFASEWLVNNDVCASSIDKVFADGSLGDIKTSARIHIMPYTWQLSIYKYLLESMNPGLVVPHLYIIHVRDGKAKLIEVQPIERDVIVKLMECERKGIKFSDVYDLSALENDDEEVKGILSEDEVAEYHSLLEQKALIDEAKEALESRFKELNDKLLNSLVDRSNSAREGLKIGNATLSWVKESKKQSVDTKKLKEKYPEIYAELLKESVTKGYIKTTIHN